jgi:exopolysaccharide production protein ExoQ
MWFENNPGVTIPSATSNLEGSPVDAAAFGSLIVVGIVVLSRRKKKLFLFLGVMTPVIAYFAYSLISVSWSPVPIPSLKRWIKDMGDVLMVLIILTDNEPVAALRRVFSRVGFILFPLSAVLIRYTLLGRAWDNDGMLSIVGVTTNKNMFGLILFVISLGTLWNFKRLLLNRSERNRNQRLFAQGVLLLFEVFLLRMAHSSTSITCFVLASTLMLIMSLRAVRSRPSRVYAVSFAMFALGGLAILIGGSGDVASALGRDATFSGRTLIWSALLPTVTNPLIGTGFDSYWNSPNVLQFQQTLNSLGWYHAEGLNEAHDGYLEVYLNLGWIGVSLLALVLVTGYWRACKAFKREHDMGSLLLAYILSGLIYNITEAGFRTLGASWIFILLSVIGASAINAGLISSAPIKRRVKRSYGTQVVLGVEDSNSSSPQYVES